MNNSYKNEQDRNFEQIFRSPGAVYRGTPFWAWNSSLELDRLKRQIADFEKMGFGGFHMHSRTGLKTEYLGKEFMKAVKECVAEAKSKDMLAWLYDEDRFPSGSAGGMVTRDRRFSMRRLFFSPYSPTEIHKLKMNEDDTIFFSCDDNAKLLGHYGVELDDDGQLVNYIRLKKHEELPSKMTAWYAYLKIDSPHSWFNNQTYVDTLNPEAIEKFIELTHERYRAAVGEEFGATVPAIFTDEPQFAHKIMLNSAKDRENVILPFTDDFPESFKMDYNEDILDQLPEVIWNLPNGKLSRIRYYYHDHVTKRFVAAFADQLGKWCKENNLILTGHVMGEGSLNLQTCSVGETMRSYRAFQIPGIDILGDRYDYTTVKQAQSAARQYDRAGVMCELYGVTDWSFDFVGYKAQSDWLAAMGVTVRVPHLAWLSMSGEAKRDYPASIGPQSPWFKEFHLIEDHAARINTVLTQGKPVVRVGVLHPIESYWLLFGPKDSFASERETQELNFKQLCEWLLFGLVDFDYICESLLPELTKSVTDSIFPVGAMNYDVVIVPPMRTIRMTTLVRIEDFIRNGGKVIFAGEIPSMVDGMLSDKPEKVAIEAERIPFAQNKLLATLNEVRDLDIFLLDGSRAQSMLYQLRTEHENRYLFICNLDKTKAFRTRIVISGFWQLTWLDTRSGDIKDLSAVHKNGKTTLDYYFHPHGHILLKLKSASQSKGIKLNNALPMDECLEKTIISRITSPVNVSLNEPNVLVLDQPKWRVNGGNWCHNEEILRIDNRVRKFFKLEARSGFVVQPWSVNFDDSVLGTLELLFEFNNEVRQDNVSLALEMPENVSISLNGEAVKSEVIGFWVDEDIKKVKLPPLKVGRNELKIYIPYFKDFNLERFYLLGDFGVRLEGLSGTLTAPVRNLNFGDITSQGLPFYTGNISYHCPFDVTTKQNLSVRLPGFKGALVKVKLDGKNKTSIAFAPFISDLGIVQPGHHLMELTLAGNRFNAFGAFHNCDGQRASNPQRWRSSGQNWCYEYKLCPLGIIFAPQITDIIADFGS
jgi:hypothetical protein